MSETASSSRQVGFALAILGLVLWPRYVRNRPGGCVLMVVSGLHATLLIRMTSMTGYLSERHTAVIVMTGCYPAALALTELARMIARQSRPHHDQSCVGRGRRRILRGRNTVDQSAHARWSRRTQGRGAMAGGQRTRLGRDLRSVLLGAALRRKRFPRSRRSRSAKSVCHHRGVRQPAFSAAADAGSEGQSGRRPTRLPLAG